MLTESNSAALCLPFICLVETTPPPILFPTEVLRVFEHAYQISKAKDAWFLQEFFEWHWFDRSLLRVSSWSIHTYTAVYLGWSVGFFSFSYRLSPLPSFCPHFSLSLSSLFSSFLLLFYSTFIHSFSKLSVYCWFILAFLKTMGSQRVGHNLATEQQQHRLTSRSLCCMDCY